MAPLLGLAVSLLPNLLNLAVGKKTGSIVEQLGDTAIKVAREVFKTEDVETIKAKMAADESLTQQFIARMQAETERFRAELEDVQSARARDVEVRKLSGGTNIRANVMLIGAFLCLTGVLVATVFYRKDIPDGVLALMNMSAGALLGMLVQAFNFEFGSSRGSSEKTDQMAQMLAKQ